MEAVKISLEAARVNVRLNQKQAAKLLGISSSTLQNYEAGKTIPNWEMVGKITALYKLPADNIHFGLNYV